MSALKRITRGLKALENIRNPVHVAIKRLVASPGALMTVVDRQTGVKCECLVSSYHMFGETWYTRVYDVPGVHIRKGDVVIDIGANQGFFTCYAARLGAKVYAFEPYLQSYARLLYNIKQNGFEDNVVARSPARSAIG